METVIGRVRLLTAAGVGKRTVELLLGEAHRAVPVGRVRQDREQDLIWDGGLTRTPSGGAESIATAAAPRPRLTRSWVKVPPKE